MTELVMYIIVRTDLNMSRGKIAAQVGHAVAILMTMNPIDKINDWFNPINGNQKKIILAVPTETILDEIYSSNLHVGETCMCIVKDSGATELKSGTITCIGIGIVDKGSKQVNRVLGSLPPLR